MRRTANRVPITEGLRVWDNNLSRVTITLAGSWEEAGELWFETLTDSGQRAGLSSSSRVSTVHPFTGQGA